MLSRQRRRSGDISTVTGSLSDSSTISTAILLRLSSQGILSQAHHIFVSVVLQWNYKRSRAHQSFLFAVNQFCRYRWLFWSSLPFFAQVFTQHLQGFPL